jgi:hypothetical protein
MRQAHWREGGRGNGASSIGIFWAGSELFTTFEHICKSTTVVGWLRSNCGIALGHTAINDNETETGPILANQIKMGGFV